MSSTEDFYSNPYFENLKITKPFRSYLQKETKKLKRIRTGKLLEIGCGGGRLFSVLSCCAGEVIGIEIAERQYRLAAKVASKFSNISVFHSDAATMSFPDDSFDIVVMAWNTFGNLAEKRDSVLVESMRVLRPSGRLLLSVLSDQTLEPYLEMLKENNLAAEKITDGFVYLREGLVSERFSRKKLEEIFQRFNLRGQIEELTQIAYWCEVTK